MKCCGSPATSIVREPGRAREVAASFDAMLFAEVFKPFAKAMGFYGDTVVGVATRALARDERGGLTDRLERALESVARASEHGVEDVP